MEFLEKEISSQVILAQGDLLPPDEEDWVVVALRGVNKGERDNVAIKLAGYYIFRGEPEPRVQEMMRSWNLRNPEPLSDKALSKCVISAARMEYRKQVKTGAKEGRADPEDNGNLPWEEQRHFSLQGLGERLELPISDIRVTKSDESMFEIFLGDDGSVTISAADLIDQRLCKKRFASAGLLVPKRVIEPKGGGAWDSVFKQIVRLSILQDVGEESTALGQLKEFLNAQIENYHGLAYFNSSQTIPPHCSWFIVQRKTKNPTLYCRVGELYIEARNYGYKTLQKLTILLPSLGHEKEIFKWNRQTVRAWAMDMDKMSTDIKEMVYRKTMEKKESEE